MTKKLENLAQELGANTPKPVAKKGAKAPKKAAPKEELPKPKKNITLEDLSPELIQAIIDKVTVKNLTQSPSPANNVNVFMEEKDTDVNDVLAEPCVFFTYGLGKTIMDDKRNGRIVVPPFSYKNDKNETVSAPYRFQKQYATEKQGNNRDARKLWISTCVERSKSRAEWLRRHSMFNIAFFEDIKKVQSVDIVMQEKLVEAAMVVRRLNDTEVVWRCQNENMPMSQNIEEMRQALTNKIALKEFQNMASKSTNTIRNYMEAIESIGKDGKTKGLMMAH